MLLKWIASKWKKYDIVKVVDGQEVLYLRRYFIWRCKWFNIYLHHIVRPDEDPDPHDHPWDFISFKLRGGYTEEVFRNRDDSYIKEHRAPGVGKRKAETVHQIRSVLPNTWTLIITGPWRRNWGFVTGRLVGRDVWVFWREYLNAWDFIDMD